MMSSSSLTPDSASYTRAPDYTPSSASRARHGQPTTTSANMRSYNRSPFPFQSSSRRFSGRGGPRTGPRGRVDQSRSRSRTYSYSHATGSHGNQMSPVDRSTGDHLPWPWFVPLQLKDKHPIVNPMRSRTYRSESIWRWVELGTLGIILAPLRMLLIVILLTVCCILCSLATCGYKESDYNRPMACWRTIFLKPLPLFGRLIFLIMGYYHIPTSGHCASKREAPIIVANHVSFIEAMLLASRHLPMFVSRKENADLPFVGRIAIAMQAILLDRQDKKNRNAVKNKILERATNDEFRQHTMIFPEGTVENQLAIMRFQAGAFSCGLPVQPIAVKHPFKYLDPSWVDAGPSLGGLCWRVLSQIYNKVELQYLPVYHPSAEERQNSILYASNVQKLIASHLDVPATQHSFDDAVLSQLALNKKYPYPDAGVIELPKLRSYLHISLEDAKMYFREFIMADIRRKGVLNHMAWKQLSLTFYDRSVFDGDSQSSNLSNDSRAPLLTEDEPMSPYETRVQIQPEQPSSLDYWFFRKVGDVQRCAEAVADVRLRSQVKDLAKFENPDEFSVDKGISFWAYTVCLSIVDGRGPNGMEDYTRMVLAVFCGSDCKYSHESEPFIERYVVEHMLRSWYTNIQNSIQHCMTPFVRAYKGVKSNVSLQSAVDSVEIMLRDIPKFLSSVATSVDPNSSEPLYDIDQVVDLFSTVVESVTSTVMAAAMSESLPTSNPFEFTQVPTKTEQLAQEFYDAIRSTSVASAAAVESRRYPVDLIQDDPLERFIRTAILRSFFMLRTIPGATLEQLQEQAKKRRS